MAAGPGKAHEEWRIIDTPEGNRFLQRYGKDDGWESLDTSYTFHQLLSLQHVLDEYLIARPVEIATEWVTWQREKGVNTDNELLAFSKKMVTLSLVGLTDKVDGEIHAEAVKILSEGV